MTGVMMYGSSETKMSGPRTTRAMLSTISAIARPKPITKGRVIRAKVSVKRRAR